MNRSSYYLLLTILIFISGMPFVIQSDTSAHRIIETTDLARLGKSSEQTNRPILLLMSQEDCPSCKMLKREILNPMVLSGDYDNRIIMRELMIDSDIELRGFDGYKLDVSIIASDYVITTTPTMLFLGPDGKELTKRIVGINTPELFSFYVDKAIDKATTKLKAE